MLRKDVKLGFAIGGIMLAVVIVYVLVVPGGDKKAVSVVNDDSQGKTDTAPSPLASDGKTAEPETATSANAPPADPSKVGADQTAANSQSGSRPGGQTNNPSGSSPAVGGNANGSAADWNKLLAEGSSSPTMMSETPTLDTKHSNGAAADQPAPAPTDATSASPGVPLVDPAAPADKATPDLSVDTASTPATQPAASAQRTHIVQPGEMLTSIAAAAYGDSRKWKWIANANPNINPNRLAPGTKLIIPALKSSGESSAGTDAAANLDPQKQYEVQPNDSLYRISMKLYGNAEHVDKLYEANKDVIGPDPKRLKLHMVLKLTDPPTSTLSTASR